MGSKKSTTTQENKPPQWATPLFTQSASAAGNLYNSGVGGNTYMGDTVSGLSDTTMQGVNQLAQAGQGWDTSGTRPLYQQIGAGAVSNPFINQLQSASEGVNGTSDLFKSIYSAAGQPTSAATNLQGYASGANLKGEGNPFYRQRLESDLADTAAQVRSAMSGMGRIGSGAETRELTDRIGRQRIEALEGDYNREQQNQFNAVGMIDAARQAALGTQTGAASGVLQGQGLQGNMLSNAGGMYSTGIGQAQTAANSMAGLDQQNFTNRLTGAGATLQAGNILDQNAQAQLQDEVAKWYAKDNEDWTRLGMLQSAAAGAAGPYGSQVAQSRQPVGIGGIMSGFGSLLGKSDARVKENIVPLGWNNGFPTYAFNYIGRPERYIGVMAGEVMQRMPDAVMTDSDGFMMVDYRKIGSALTRIN